MSFVVVTPHGDAGRRGQISGVQRKRQQRPVDRVRGADEKWKEDGKATKLLRCGGGGDDADRGDKVAEPHVRQ